MNKKSIEELLSIAKYAACEAGKEIMAIYSHKEFAVELKEDKSPLTLADTKSHEIIKKYLQETSLPILSEEGKSIDYEVRKQWELFWLVDPLDGTKEFINRNDEFTVNIALIDRNESILGVVYAPVLEKLYWAVKGEGSYVHDKGGCVRSLKSKSKSISEEGLCIVGSRHHLDERTSEFIAKLNKPEFVCMGSSLKFLVIAEGEADLYPRFAPTMEWDTAAAQIILEASGGKVVDYETNSRIFYNKLSLLNPYFLASGDLD